MKRKPVRLAFASLVAVLSVLGLSQSGVATSVSARGDHSWCC